MNSALSALIDLYVFPTGRRLYALARVSKNAKAYVFPELSKHCAAAITHDRACLLLERQWEGVVAESKGKAPAGAAQPSAANIDPDVDRTLTAIRDHAIAQTAGAKADDSIHADVASFLKTIFPAGVQAVTGLPYVEELAVVDTIVAALQGKDLAPFVKELGLGRLAKRLAELAVDYRRAIEAPTPGALAFGDVRAARIKGHDSLLEAVAIILGKYHGSSAEDVAARDELLGPILEQNEAIGASMRARRTVVDVNPETGAQDPTGAGGAPGAMRRRRADRPPNAEFDAEADAVDEARPAIHPQAKGGLEAILEDRSQAKARPSGKS